MARFGLCGASYASQSPVTDAEKTKNWIPEINESPDAKSKVSLVPRGGLVQFSDLGDLPIRAIYWQNGVLVAASGQDLYVIAEDGTASRIGSIAAGDDVVTVASTQKEAIVCSGGEVWLWTATAYTKIDLPPVSMVGQTDGYFIALLKDDNKFRISALFDGSSWDPLDVAEVSLFPGNIRSMLIDHREIWLGGDKNSVPYYNAGDPDFPFFPVLNGFIEAGIGSPHSAVRLDNSVFWLDADERGGAVARRAQGYTPSRVSDHAVEAAWRKYLRIDDAVGYAIQWNGHPLWMLYFPSVKLRVGTQEMITATWVFNAAAPQGQAWTEWTWLNPQTALEEGFLGRCHAYSPDWNKHFVGDRNSGKIYELSSDALDDAGNPIRYSRTSPYIADEKKRIFHSLLELDAESGLASITDGDGTIRAPQVMMRFSDNGAKNWSNETTRDLGLSGEYSTRQRWLRLGQSRGRVYEISVTDACGPRITDGYVVAS